MRGSLVRRCGILLAALALPVLFIGTASAASSSAKLSSATLNGSGSSFQYGFNQVVIGGFKQQQKAVTINYQPTGSGAGRTDFLNKVTDFGGTDAPYKSTDPQPPAPFFYFPTVVAPITVSYNAPGVSNLNLSADTIAKIFQAQITTWDDAAIKAENPKAKLPSTTITVVHRSDSSGTTANFTNFLVKASPSVWTLGTGSTVSWPASTQGGAQNTGVANLVKNTDGAIGYVDFSDATASDLTFASIKNSTGKFIKPSIASASAAANGASINADLTYDPINSDGATAYPITSPTWIMVYQTQSDAAKGNAIKGFLNYIYGDGQKLASSVDYAPLPKGLLKQAKAQVNKIVVPAT
ncbi:MAG TPA: phosphate ABC transporter substrate-binding protein PstS [Acidimicrobiia bacterium]|nr:phosphate ABC transporter substrate-binding protein PstS [Acidimicrobiia bacterium]